MIAWRRSGRAGASLSRLARDAPPLRGCGLDRLALDRQGLPKRSWLRVSEAAPHAMALKLIASDSNCRTIAIRDDGQRMPPWERQIDRLLRGAAAPSRWSEAERLTRLRDQVEPALNRELGKKGVLNGDGADTAELVARVELV